MQLSLFFFNFIGAVFCFLISLILWFYYLVLPSFNATETICIRLLAICTIIIYCINCFTLSYRIKLLDSDQQPSTLIQWDIAYITFAVWRIAQSFTYILFILRLKETFHGTKYASYSWSYKVLYIISILFIIPELAKDAIYKLLNPSLNIKDIIIVVEFIISAVIDLGLSISLLYLFLRKLYLLNLDIAYLNHTKLNDAHLQKYMKINHITAKISLLTVCSVASTQVLMALFCIVFFMHNEGDSMLIISYIWIIVWVLDCCINSICIFFSFDFTLQWYFGCCKRCHKHCVKCCTQTGIYNVEQMLSYSQLNETVNTMNRTRSINNVDTSNLLA